MDEAPHVCPKCNSPMEQGFTVDMGTGDILFGKMLFGKYHVSKWAPGAPLKSLLFRTRVPPNWLPIGTFRCVSCGYVESYARPEFASKSDWRFSLWSLLVFMTVIAILLAVIAWISRL
jgi:hypothetical protein